MYDQQYYMRLHVSLKKVQYPQDKSRKNTDDKIDELNKLAKFIHDKGYKTHMEVE